MNNSVGRGQGRKLIIHEEGPHDAIAAVVSPVQNTGLVADGIRVLVDTDILDVVNIRFAIDHRIQHYRVLAVGIGQPGFIQQVGQRIAAVAAGKGYIYIVAVFARIVK